MSLHLLSEVADVLRRDRIQARWPLTDEEVRSYCRYLAQVSVEVSPRALPRVIHDPKDQAIVEAAVAGSADVICTPMRISMPIRDRAPLALKSAEVLAKAREYSEKIKASIDWKP